ncbi:MAG: helix-turn-helix domain-containing protein [Salinivirgaceae bacterium]|nr:helix-turn-helix domain-containing protein [Salinivirgaceae bacterium]
MEILKQVKLKGVPDIVEVNEDGSIIKYKGKVVSTYSVHSTKGPHAYKACHIGKKNFYVHRIIAEAYVKNPKPVSNKFVMHLSVDISNNHYSNLKWGDGKDLHAKNKDIGLTGTPAHRNGSPISYEEALKVAKRLDSGEFAKDICLEYGVSEMSIARIRKRYCNKTSVSPRYENDIKTTVFKLSQKYSAPEIAKITGLKYHTIYRWLKKMETEKPAFIY